MPPLPSPFRRATPADARALAGFYDIAGWGLQSAVWADWAAPGESPHDVGARLIAAEDGDFSYAAAVVADEGAGPFAALIGWRLEGPPAPAPHPLLEPLYAFDPFIPDAWYLDVLAVAEEARGRGLGSAMLALAEEIARASGAAEIALDAVDANVRALALYARAGYREKMRLPMAKTGWDVPGREWVLMTKPL